MGTNYYIKGYPENDSDNPIWHIGKRSAAGSFCFDCGITLCKGGANRVHYDDDWYNECPRCRKKPIIENIENSAVGIELGYFKNPTKLKEGVASASSFTFAMSFMDISSRVLEEFKNCPNDTKVIEDEYGREFTYMEFVRLVKAIPKSLHFKHEIGKEFS